MKKLAPFFLCAFLIQSVSAQYLSRLDLTFGDTDQSGNPSGIMMINKGVAAATAKYRNDRILIAGNVSNLVHITRIYSDGSPDASFDGGTSAGGTVQYNIDGTAATVTDIAVDEMNDRIIVVGHTAGPAAAANNRGFILCLNSNGSVNTGFNSNATPQGIAFLDLAGANDYIHTVGIQKRSPNAGKIVVAGVSGTKPMVARFNANGTADMSATGFREGQYIIPTPYPDAYIYDLDISSSDQIVLIASYVYFYVIRLNANGALEPGFNPNGNPAGILQKSGTSYEAAVEVKFHPKDLNKILILSRNLNNCRVTQLKSTGEIDSSFNFSGFNEINTSDMDYPVSMEIDQYGRILVSGYIQTGNLNLFSAYRLQKDGSMDHYFSVSNLNSIAGIALDAVITPDERLLIAGYSGAESMIAKIYIKDFHSYYAYLPTKYIGSDPFPMPPYSPDYKVTYNSNTPKVASVTGNKVTLRDTGNAYIRFSIPGDSAYYDFRDSTLLLVKDNPPAIIIGQKILKEGEFSEEYYSVKPDTLGGIWHMVEFDAEDDMPSYEIYNYASPVTGLLFRKNFKGGILTYTFYDAFQRQYVIEKIINVSATELISDAQQLDTLKCSQEITSCAGNYLDHFKIHTLASDSTGCSMGGYNDYTYSEITTTLLLGSVYTASAKISSNISTSRYVGLWLDYDNNGDFLGADEFLGVAFTDHADVKISNIVLKNNEAYAGPRRLRVRVRPAAPFLPGDACQANGESGETEDYLVTLKAQEKMQAPHIITPNNDGKNDLLVIRGINPKLDNKLVIFDRMGQVKFSRTNYQNDWDGKDKEGNLVSKGTYYYIFTNGDESIKGFFEVLY